MSASATQCGHKNYYYNRFTALCPGLHRWASTHHPDHHPTFISFFHLPRSIASSLFKLHAWQSFCTTSLHVLFGLPLCLEPFTSYSKHFLTQSVSSFRSTCPYHYNLFCCSTKIISSIPSLSLNSLLGTLSFTLTLHIHLTILISARWSEQSWECVMLTAAQMHKKLHTYSLFLAEKMNILMPVTDDQETCTRNWHQFLAPNRTCSIRYKNLVTEKVDARLHVICTRNRYQFFWYQFLTLVSCASVTGITEADT